MDLNEARKNLELVLSEELKKEYFAILRQLFLFCAPITKEQFDSRARTILVRNEQIRAHNNFMLALLYKISSNSTKTSKSFSDKGIFEHAEFSDYIQPSSPTMLPPIEFQTRTAANELFIPDQVFISSRIAFAAWDHGLDGADENISEILMNACQTLVRNVITAMITRKKGYKIRDGKFQYGYNQPIPDPFLRNYSNIIDDTQETKVEVVDDEDTFAPKPKTSLERAEQQVAFAYSCTKRKRTDNTLTVKLLYDTLRSNPNILGLSATHNSTLLKLGLQLDM